MTPIVFSKPGSSRQYAYSLLIIVLVTAVCYGLSNWIGYHVVALILLLTVSMLAITFDILPVLLSAALSAFIWNFFFIPPRFTFHVNTTEDSILLIMYFVIAMINGVLTYKIRQLERSARLKEERANSVKLYNTILNSLSHELRTPISAIIGAADNLQMNSNISETEREELIAEISTASLRLNQQVENLLNLSRLESGHIKPKNDWCDVQELIYDMVQRVEESHPHRKIGVSMNQEIPFCWLDKVMLEQVIYNLLINAAIHTPPKTAIDVTVMCHGDLLQIIIEDNGPGFKEVDVKDVFHKFSRDHMQHNKGHGLGLSIVKGFTEALGGTVEAQNKKSGGALFRVYLPVKVSYFKLGEA